MARDKNGTIQIETSGDEMCAMAFIMPPEGNGKAVSVTDVKKALKETGIVHGIVNDERILVFVEEGKKTHLDFMVAAGTPPGHGTDASVAFSWKDAVEKSIKDEKARVDLRELNIVKSVGKGDVIARKVLPTRGVEGMAVTGKEALEEWGTDIALKAGNNVTVSEDGTEFIAAEGGSPKVAGGVISVDPVFIVSGDVDYSTGNISFAGALEIRGNVLDGFMVRADGNITIGGNVQACDIHSGGDIVVKGGIITRKEGTVSASGGVYAKFVENSIVEAEKDVVAQRAIINSLIRANGSVICTSSEGRIMAGDVMAFTEIRARQLGTENETQTLLRAGFKYDVYLKMADLEQKLAKLIPDVERIHKSMSSARSSQAEIVVELRKNLDQMEIEKRNLTQSITRLRMQVQVNPFATVKGEDFIHAGCVVYIGTSRERIVKPLKYATLMSDRDGGIALSSYDEATRTTNTVQVGTREKKKTVMIVDDAKFMRNKLRNILENGNFKVIGEAEDGRQAINMYTKLSPDVVTMDITMPNVDGIAALTEIRKMKPEARIIMISALGQKEKIKDSIVAGAMDFILKPFVPEKVVDTVARVSDK